MGKGIGAALLMAEVRATLRAAAQRNPPAMALNLATAALLEDLNRSGSFVTLFHGQLDVTARVLSYVDIGHGRVFLRKADKTVVDLPLGGLPLGVRDGEEYQQGSVTFSPGDTLVIYSDGLIDAHPEPELDHERLASLIDGATTAQDMVDRLTSLPGLEGSPPDDLTVLVLHCSEEDRPWG